MVSRARCTRSEVMMRPTLSWPQHRPPASCGTLSQHQRGPALFGTHLAAHGVWSPYREALRSAPQNFDCRAPAGVFPAPAAQLPARCRGCRLYTAELSISSSACQERVRCPHRVLRPHRDNDLVCCADELATREKISQQSIRLEPLTMCFIARPVSRQAQLCP